MVGEYLVYLQLSMETEKRQHIEELILENQRLLAENNTLLKKMNRRSVLGFWFRLLWSLALIAIPILFYFYYIEPRLESFSSSFEKFEQNVPDISGLKQWYQSVQEKAE